MTTARPRGYALVIVDLQNDFCKPYGALAINGGRELVPTINQLLELPFALKIATRDYHPHDHTSFHSRHMSRAKRRGTIIIYHPDNPLEEQDM
ncbi:NAD(+) salvage pathway protein [Elasticomyces elasticus]|nr:NAD(+) salvage pathway protein [Elasticomyces elasticus]KAK3653287.1 NAD(+) salvage pathway protein [Elasticomyces elasticus]KAK4918268.1 NAD(+) salvage pathway protein [Elasticomyces elasticus]KAK5758346.1 NAD(+) salvage pathway protein [Elasticomyces elasticus]